MAPTDHDYASCTVIATANTANYYQFVNWTEGGTPVSGIRLLHVHGNGHPHAGRELHATRYTISVSANPSGWGTVSGGGHLHRRYQLHGNGYPGSAYAFVKWTEGGSPVSTSANYTFTVTGDRTLVAQFRVQEGLLERHRERTPSSTATRATAGPGARTAPTCT